MENKLQEIVGIKEVSIEEVIKKEDKSSLKKAYSWLYFMRDDLKAIKKLKIKSEKINEPLKSISDNVNLLMNLLFSEIKE